MINLGVTNGFCFFKHTSMRGKGKMSFKLLTDILKDLFFPRLESIYTIEYLADLHILNKKNLNK